MGNNSESNESNENENVSVCQFSFIVHQQSTYKIIQNITINGIKYKIDELDNLYDFKTFKFIKNLNIDDNND